MCPKPLTRRVVGLSLALALWPMNAAANDAAFAGPAAELIPLKETRIQMRSERIILEIEAGQPRWRALATYRFRNPKRKAITLQLGFPEAHCGPEGECAADDGTRFHQMQTTVRGKEVELRTGKVAADNDWVPEIGKVWLFDVTFAPREEVEIVHRYEFYAGPDVFGRSIHYITRTGRLWNGPIGKAEFIIRQPERPWTVTYPRGFRLRSFTERRVGEANVTELVFKMKRWRPKKDLVLHFGGDQLATLAGKCPDTWMILQAVKAEKKTPGALKRVLHMRSREDLRLCRNRVYARHGYKFSDKKLGKRFYGNKGIAPDVEIKLSKNRGDRVIGLQVNKDYKPSLLSADEKVYVEALSKEESRRR